MKKVLTKVMVFVCIITCFSACVVNAKVGDAAGEAKHTDIVAYINHYALPSYAVNGQSCIVAEDLKGFGFDVIWNASARSLEISRNTNNIPNEMTVNKFEKSGTRFADVLETDIKVYANGVQLTSYALNGYTMIPMEELGMYGQLAWVDGERALKLWIDGLKVRESKQLPEKTKISAPIGEVFCVDGIGFYTNSADGIEVYWQAKNNTGKTINYYTTYYSLYNPVGDPAYCTIAKTNKLSTKTVGPVAPGEELLNLRVIAYTPVCEYISLDKIFLEYSDGTTEWIEYGYVGGETVWDKYDNPKMGLSIYK